MIYIILPVFNRIQHTIKCIESLYSNDTQFVLVLVDDGSTDSTSKIVRQRFPDVDIVAGDGGLWWTASINAGILHVQEKYFPAEDDYILTINNDLVVKSDYLKTLKSTFNSHRNAVIGSISVDIGKTDYMSYCGVEWNKLTAKRTDYAKSLYKNSLSAIPSETSLIKTDLIPGRGVMYPSRLISEIGLYRNELFPQYAADEDFSLRAKKKGYSLWVSTKALVYSHTNETGIYENQSTSLLKYMELRYTSRKSPVNLITRYRWAKEHSSFLPVYFAIDFLRVTVGSFKSWKRNRI